MFARMAYELFSNKRWMEMEGGCRSRDLTGRPCQSLVTILSIFVYEGKIDKWDKKDEGRFWT